MLNKILGAFSVIGCSFFIGKKMTDKLKKRELSLTTFHNIFVMLESEINFSANSIDQAFINISKAVEMSDFFEYVIYEFKEHGIRKAWYNSITKFQDELCLADNDVKILKTLSAELGVTDKENQIKNIRHVLSLLEVAEKEAHDKYSSLSKIYRNISISAGLATVILLI